MSPTVNDLVEKTRSMVWGGLGDVLNVLADDYVAGVTPTITLREPTNVANGAMVSVGLNTFYVLRASGTNLTILPSADGSPDVDANAGTIVRVKPKATTWSIFREVHDGIKQMASPLSGVFRYLSFEASPNYRDGVYALPEGWWDAVDQPLKLKRAIYKERGTQRWRQIHNADFFIERYAVYLMTEPRDASRYEFTFAFPFIAPTALTDNVFDLGLTNDTMLDLPCLYAAKNLSRSVEGRRVQPFAQGDSRRPTEVPVTSSLAVSRDFAKEYDDLAAAERTRQAGLFTAIQPVGALG